MLTLVAFVLVQVSVAVLPLATVVGFAVNVTVGGPLDTVTVAEAVTLPPGPVAVNI
jgi:hypothetical protein